MTDKRDITLEESLNHTRFIRELIGKNRLSNEFDIIKIKEEQIRESSSKIPKFGYDKEFHPLFYLLWKTEKQLEDSAKNGQFRATDELTRVSSLGEDLLTLINSDTEGLQGKIANFSIRLLMKSI